MKLLRNVLIIVVVLLIFVFFFAGKGVFDDILPINQVKGAVELAVGSKQVVDNGKYGIMVKKDQEDLFIEYLEGQGYDVEQNGREYTATKDGKTESYIEEEFLGCLLFKAEVPLSGQQADHVV